MTDFRFHSEEIHVLFSKYLGREYYTMVRRIIQSKHYVPQLPPKKKYDSDGYEIKEFRTYSVHEELLNHTWLEYNDRFDVDLLRGSLNLLLTDGKKKEPEFSVTRGLLTSNNSNWSGMEGRLLQCGFRCGPVQVAHIGPKATAERMAADHGLLERIYKRILSDEGRNLRRKNSKLNDPI